MKRPRGTRDLYGAEMEEFNYVCDSVKKIFSSFGYGEVRTPIFESVEVFAANDGGFLTANKEFFHLQNKRDPAAEPEFVLRPENTAAVVRMASEDKLIGEKNLKTLSYFYCGPCFRYERPQSGRFRQFTQAGVEKINASSPDSDVENILLMQKILEFFGLKKVRLKCNYLGCEDSKRRWKEALSEYFRKYEDQLSEDSRRRIDVNPFRILDDKEDGGRDFVRSAPKIEDHLTEDERTMRGFLEIKIGKAINDGGFSISNDIFRGIDYYDGLVYEWVYVDEDPEGEPCEITVAAGGRYDGLFRRFDKRAGYPSLGFAIGIERLCMALKREGRFPKSRAVSAYVCFEDVDGMEESPARIRELLFPERILKNPNFSCFVSYERMAFEKHVATASRMGKEFFYFRETKKKRAKPQKTKGGRRCVLKNIPKGINFRCRFLWRLSISAHLMKNGPLRSLLLYILG